MSLDLCINVAKSNKANDHLKGIRITEDGSVFASDFVNTVKRESIAALKGLDCYVDASKFADGWKSCNPNIVCTLTDNELVLSQSNKKEPLKVKLTKLPADQFKVRLEEPIGEDVEPKNFMKALQNVLPFTKLADATTYIIGKFLYVTDQSWVVRTALECDFPEALNTKEEPLTFSKQFIEMVTKWQGALTNIRVSNTNITAVFDTGWISSSRYEVKAPMDWPKAFAYEEKLAPLDPDILISLRAMCESSEEKDMITFSPTGITMKQENISSWNIECKMPPFLMRASDMLTVISHGNEFSFDSPRRALFKGSRVEGLWPSKPPVRERPVEEKELETAGKGKKK